MPEQPPHHLPGLRGRIIAPMPPAPVPVSRPAPTPAVDEEPVIDRSALTSDPSASGAEAAQQAAAAASSVAVMERSTADEPDVAEPAGSGAHEQVTGDSAGAESNEQPGQTSKGGDRDLLRSTGSMAVATLLSRITGFVRTAMIGAALGGAVADAFNTANTLPNLITEIVLGSVLTALVVPVLVRAEKEDADHGEAFIRRLFTLTFSLVTVVTIVAVVGAPLLTRLMLKSEGAVNVYLSTSFAFLLLPQIFFYGLFSLFMAVLNTKGYFRPGAWAPVANNLIAIAVMLLYMLLPSSLSAADQAPFWDPHVLLLGLGTTLGVVAQCLIMLPPLRRAGVNLRPLWGIDDRLKQFGGMAVAIIVYVAISQLGYIVNSRVASDSSQGAITIYSYHWLLLQVPYGIIGVTLLTAIMPRLSRNAADGDDRAVVRDLTLATKLTFIALIPIIVFFVGFGEPIAMALFQFGRFDEGSASILGLTLSVSAFTLIPYALVMLHLRVFYAREMAWTPTYIIAGITLTKIALALAAPMVTTSPQYVVVLLGAANGFGFLSGAIVGAFLLSRKLGSLNSRSVVHTSLWALGSSLVGVAVALLVQLALHAVLEVWLETLGNIGQLMLLAVCGVIFLIVTGIVLSRSGLPEVQNLGRMFARIPGLGRFIRPDEGKAIQVEAADPHDLSAQLAANDAFNASPVPPPMSAGVVRGPRLVPGAPVSDGRFRLLADHGNVQGAQFWKAREVASGKDVALTFVDTSGQAPLAPRTPAEMARTSALVSKRTRQLSELNHPGVADNVRILSYRSGALIVADWVDGSSLRSVAETAADPDNDLLLNPHAVALALAPIASAAADAEAAGTPLGLDNASRIRINLDGEAVLAFPAVLPDASVKEDVSSLASAIEILAGGTCHEGDEVDEELAQIAYDARTVANETAAEVDADEEDGTTRDTVTEGNAKVRDLAARLHRFGSGPVAVADAELEAGEPAPEAAEVEGEQATPQASTSTAARAARVAGARHHTETDQVSGVGFGSRGYTGRGTAFIVGAAMLFVVLAAAATALVVSVVSGDSDTAPITTDSIQGAETKAAAPKLPIILKPKQASVWQASPDFYGQDNPDKAPLLIDADNHTSWISDSYPNGLGAKPGVGIALTLDEPAVLEQLRADANAAGARLTVYAVPAGTDPASLTQLDGLTRLATAELSPGRTSIDLKSPDPATKNAPVGGVIVWFSDLGKDQEAFTIHELSLVGTR
ncbi:hypothetical protein GCM10028828_10480 [Corynebacterium tapiri]